MSTELVISLKMDRSHAEQEAKAFHAAERERISKTLSAAEVAQKAETEFIKRENQQRIQEAARAKKTDIELAKEAAEQQKRLAKEAAAEQKRIAADAAKAEREAKKQAAEEARAWTKRSLTDAEVAERAKTAITKQENQKRIQAVVDAHGKEKGVVDELKTLWQGKVGAIDNARVAVGLFAAGAITLRTTVQVLDALDERWKYIAASTNKAAQEYAKYHALHLELSGFSGTPGQTSAETEKTTGLVAASGLKMEDAAALRRSARAGAYAITDRPAIPAQNGMPAVPASEGYVSPKTLDKAEVMAARYAVVAGGNSADYGKAIATIPALVGRRMEAGEIEDHFLKLDKLATIGGFETPSDLINEVKKVQGYVASGVVRPEFAESITAMAAKNNPGEAGTLAKQMITALSVGPLMDRGFSVPDELKDQMDSMAGWFKDLGIGRNEDMEVAAVKVSDDIIAKTQAAKAAGQNFNADQYLISKGVTNQQSRMAFIDFTGNRPVYDAEVAPMLKRKFDPGTVDAMWAEHIKNDPAGRQRMVESGGDVAKGKLGAKFLPLNQFMAHQYNVLESEGRTGGSLEDYMAPDDWFFNVKRFVKGTQRETLIEPVARRLVQEMDAVGADTRMGGNGWGSGPGGSRSVYDELVQFGASPERQAEVFNTAMGRLSAAGGDTSLGGMADVKRMADDMAAIRKGIDTIAGNSRPPQPSRNLGSRPVPPRDPNASVGSW